MKPIIQKKDTSQDVDISPLIDMVFILLIFFMVSTTFVKDMKLDLERPGAKSASAASSKSLRVYIDSRENVFIDGQKIRPWVIQNKIKDIKTNEKKESVLLVTDKNVKANVLIQVVDQIRLGGLTDIGVATDQEI